MKKDDEGAAVLRDYTVRMIRMLADYARRSPTGAMRWEELELHADKLEAMGRDREVLS